MNQSLDASGFTRFRNQRSHDERAERDGISKRVGKECGGETKSDRPNQRSLGTLQLYDSTHESRNYQHTNYDETDEESDEPDDRDRQAPRGKSRTRRNRSEQCDHDNRDQILDDQYSEHHV